MVVQKTAGARSETRVEAWAGDPAGNGATGGDTCESAWRKRGAKDQPEGHGCFQEEARPPQSQETSRGGRQGRRPERAAEPQRSREESVLTEEGGPCAERSKTATQMAERSTEAAGPRPRCQGRGRKADAK